MGQFVVEPKLILDTADATLDYAPDASKVDVGFHTHGSCQVSWAGLAGTGALKLQESNNGTTWDDIAGATISVTGATGHGTIRLANNIVTKFIKVNYAHGTVSAGTVSANFHAKG